jgi:hypothetical protein
LPNASFVDAGEAHAGIAFHRSVINTTLNYTMHLNTNFSKYCFFGDDIWLASYAERQGIARVIVRPWNGPQRPKHNCTEVVSVGKKAGGRNNLDNAWTGFVHPRRRADLVKCAVSPPRYLVTARCRERSGAEESDCVPHQAAHGARLLMEASVCARGQAAVIRGGSFGSVLQNLETSA